MPATKVILPPGGFQFFTQTLADGKWWGSQLVRFFNRTLRKIGGWSRLSSTPLIGTARGMHAWADLDGNPLLVAGTEQRLTLFYLGTFYDITPLRDTANIAPDFSTVINTPTVTVRDVAFGGSAGDWIFLVVPVSVGGLILQGFYLIETVVDADHYTITAASNATSTVNNGGAVPLFNTTMGSANIDVTFANHGLAMADLFQVQVATTVGGILIDGTFPVVSVTNPNVFVIAPGALAGSTTSGSENGGLARIEYLIATGFSVATPVTGYGIGPYGAGPYGIGSAGSVIAPLRQWYIDNYGQDMVANYTGSTLYTFSPPPSYNERATPVANAPEHMTASFVSMPAQIMVSLGAETSGITDPNLVRWSDSGVITTWIASATNQAGSYRIPTGSKIIAGMQFTNEALIWTDVDLWSMQYRNYPFIFGFNKVGTQCEALSGRSIGIYGQTAVWPSNNGFFRYDTGNVTPVECTVWNFFYENLDFTQLDQITSATNSLFSEIAWYFPMTSGEIGYVKINMLYQAWDYGSSPGYSRTAWVDHSPMGNPIGADLNSLLQQHEVGNDADGMPIVCSATSGYFDLEDGTPYLFLERFIPDFKFDSAGTINITFDVTDYPGQSPVTYGPYAITDTTKYKIVRARGRQASITIGSSDLGSMWQLGALRVMTSPAGRR